MKTLIAALILWAVPSVAQGTAALAGTAYYITSSGNDSNSGLSTGAAWATAKHNINGADIIWASAGTYTASNFHQGNWGTVTTCCARLKCATFDACKISANNDYGIYVDASNWAVMGWEVNTTANAGCPATPSDCGFSAFAAAPNSSTPTNINHIIFADDVCNGAGGGCFNAFAQGTHSVDYVAFVGDIAYNGALNSLNCYSGMSVFQPLASDSNAGTHIYVGGNFIYHNVDPASCASGADNGGTGWIGDTFDGSQGLGVQYAQQLYVSNNIAVGNGAAGFEEQTYTKNPAAHTTTYWRNNTSWGNLLAGGNSALCPEMLLNIDYGLTADHNIAQPTVSSSCTSHTTYAASTYDTSDGVHYPVVTTIATNWFTPASGGGTTSTFNDETPVANTFTFGTNTSGGASPAFTAPAVPGAPSCGSATSTVNCMSTMIANFVPTATGTSGFGYQSPVATNGSDAQFPKWVCNLIDPSLITKSC